ncbi:cylicin-2-like [Fopius arisanus]|uniref:Cylicin-2-like n=1 Tax=Fopius arisanus TaxID=64838 RepID=A0A9R1TQ55_9HYME|nr:PREDICTED: cylicin-2-like [Fopius arisanus]
MDGGVASRGEKGRRGDNLSGGGTDAKNDGGGSKGGEAKAVETPREKRRGRKKAATGKEDSTERETRRPAMRRKREEATRAGSNNKEDTGITELETANWKERGGGSKESGSGIRVEVVTSEESQSEEESLAQAGQRWATEAELNVTEEWGSAGMSKQTDLPQVEEDDVHRLSQTQNDS